MKAIGLLAGLQLMLAVPLVAQQEIGELIPARPSGMLNDYAGIIDPEVAARVESRLLRLRDSTGAEIAVVTLATIGDRPAAEVALEIGRRWGVGSDAPVGDARRNAGVVMLLVPRSEERRGAIQVSTGEGVEGIITDAAAGRVADAMLPDLRNGDYSAAVDLGTELLTGMLARALGSTDSALVGSGDDRGPGILFIILLVVIVVAVMIAITSSARGGGPRGGLGSGGGRRTRHGGFGGPIFIPGGFGGGSFGGGGFGGGGFGGFGGGGGFSGGGAGRGF